MAAKTQTQPKPPTRRVIASAIRAMERVTVGDIVRGESSGIAQNRIERFSLALDSLSAMLKAAT